MGFVSLSDLIRVVPEVRTGLAEGCSRPEYETPSTGQPDNRGVADCVHTGGLAHGDEHALRLVDVTMLPQQMASCSNKLIT